jgi:hypothetical protein
VLILFDHGTPKGLIRALSGHAIHTGQSRGWDTLSNGALLNAAEEAGFELLLTTDRRIRSQQNLIMRRIALVVLSGSTKWSRVRQHTDRIAAIVAAATPAVTQRSRFPSSRSPVLRNLWQSPRRGVGYVLSTHCRTSAAVGTRRALAGKGTIEDRRSVDDPNVRHVRTFDFCFLNQFHAGRNVAGFFDVLRELPCVDLQELPPTPSIAARCRRGSQISIASSRPNGGLFRVWRNSTLVTGGFGRKTIPNARSIRLSSGRCKARQRASSASGMSACGEPGTFASAFMESFGARLVSLTFASWNQIAGWLRQLDGLPEPARTST